MDILGPTGFYVEVIQYTSEILSNHVNIGETLQEIEGCGIRRCYFSFTWNECVSSRDLYDVNK